MAYNRCIGTRYCANNCPYKVRRFNFLNFHKDVAGRRAAEMVLFNPDVTVRMRGVMEKCTYCVQRIQEAQDQGASATGARAIKDGEIVTACQQTCPADAIVFGDLNDPNSRVAKLQASRSATTRCSRSSTRKPRTTYLARSAIPNPELEA